MLVIDDITIRVAGRTLIEHASAQIPEGSRVGLVGRNGTGKTTLFRALTGELSPDGGSVRLPARARIGAIAQEAPNGPQSLLDTVLAADTERTRLLALAETAKDPQEIADIQTRLIDIDAHSAPSRAASILAGLGFANDQQSRPCAEFSGGWRMRVALASLLFTEPDLLLLDEPTNYLDLEGTLWLESYLARYPRTLVVISHDRDLLDNVCQHVLHLNDGKLTLYRGGYTAFDRQRRDRAMQDAKAARKQADERKHLQAFVDRFRAKASRARQAQSRLKRLEKLQPISISIEGDVRPIVIPSPAQKLSPPIVALHDVSVGYEADRPILRNLSLSIDTDDRVALLGANGNGKSTLAKLLSNRLAPQSGELVTAPKLRTAYFAQHQLDELRANESPYEHVRRLMPNEAEPRVRSQVAQIGFPAKTADTPVSRLSGGEKARLMLGLATYGGAHLVILDEPTNHLDIDSRAALVEAIAEYRGAVILISHDRHLLDACADRLWVVGGGTVRPYDGDLDDYRNEILGRAGERGGKVKDAREAKAAPVSKPAEPAKPKAEVRKAAADRRAELAPLQQAIVAIEKRMSTLQKELERLDAELAEPSLFQRDPAGAAARAKRRAEVERSLVASEEEWLEATVRRDELMSA